MQYHNLTTLLHIQKKIYDFKADSLKSTDPFPLGDNEGLCVTIYANDTSAAGYASDSIVAYWGLQYGRITTNYLDQKDTLWVEPTKVIDTFRMATANIKAANTFSTTDTLDPLAICTTHVSGLAYQSRIIQPYRYPVARIRIKGNTGNELTSFLRLRIDISQPKYTRVDAGQTKQPDDNGTR
ncbi:MAG TPA: hypothetical protein VFM18_03485 [Methanosarcina sp.]|nr:hypothetical protein [Methanosarcina sp.]